jgi:hypothetical protein
MSFRRYPAEPDRRNRLRDGQGTGVKAFGSDWYVVNAKGSKIDDD